MLTIKKISSMKRSFTALCVLVVLPLLGFGQNEIGLRIGLANYYGDLGERFVPSESHLAGGILYRYNLTSKWKIRGSLTRTRLSGADRTNDLEELSNLSFRSDLTELALEIEYDFLPFIPGSPNLTITPYIFGGVAGFHFNPQANYLGTFIDLQFLGTEGQNIPGSSLAPYSKYSIAFPFGLGFKKTVSDNLVFGLEIGIRPTLTDYLDDVSSYYPDFTALAATENGDIAVRLSDRRPEAGLEPVTAGTLRGDPTDKDFYGMIMFSLTKKLGASPCYAF